MKKKYFALIGVLLLTMSISALVIIAKKNKTEKDEYANRSPYLTEEQVKEIEQDKEKMIRLCEKNQEELENISKEYLELMENMKKTKEELTYEDLKEVQKQMVEQIKYTKWEILSDMLNLSIYTPEYAGDFEGNVYYICWDTEGGYSLDLIYIDTEVEKTLEYIDRESYYAGEIIEINEHLYVYLYVFPGV